MIKAPITCLLTLFISINLFGQEVINKDWFPQIKNQQSSTLAYPVETIKVQEGLGFVCDFKVELSVRKRDVSLTYSNYEDGKDGFNFPDANMRINKNDKNFTFLSTIGDTISRVGYKNSYFEKYYNDGKNIIGVMNFKLGDTLVNTFTEEKFRMESLNETSSIITDSLIYSGFGKVITFNDVYDNCVQIKRIRYKDSMPYFKAYTFYSGNFSNIVLSYLEYTSGNIEPARTLQYQQAKTKK